MKTDELGKAKKDPNPRQTEPLNNRDIMLPPWDHSALILRFPDFLTKPCQRTKVKFLSANLAI